MHLYYYIGYPESFFVEISQLKCSQCDSIQLVSASVKWLRYLFPRSR